MEKGKGREMKRGGKKKESKEGRERRKRIDRE